MARAEPECLADGRAGARADRAFRDGAARGLGRGARAHGAIGPDIRRPHREVVEDGPDDQRHDTARRREAEPASLEVRHDAEARLEPEGAPSGEDGAVNSRGDVAGVQEVEAEETRGAAAHFHGGHRAGGAEHRGAPGETDEVGGVADQEAGDIGEAAHLTAAGRRSVGARRPARRLGGEPARGDLARDLEAPFDQRPQEGNAPERRPAGLRGRGRPRPRSRLPLRARAPGGRRPGPRAAPARGAGRVRRSGSR